MYGKISNAFPFTRIDASRIDLTGLKVAIVGGTAGIGRELAKFALAKGAATTVVGRTFRDNHMNGLEFMKADFSLMSEAARVGKSLPSDLDVLVLTHGILADVKRQETAEGIEMDMAVSALSRHVLLKVLLPRLSKRSTTRVFVMGMPGSGQAGVLGDLNATKNYKQWPVHSNTVAANEALVYHWSSPRNPTGSPFLVYGLNPGLIVTDIRTPVHGGGWIGSAMEWVIGLMSPTPAEYASRIAGLWVAPELPAHTGSLFGQGGDPILPTKEFNDPAYTDKWIQGLNELEQKALGRASA